MKKKWKVLIIIASALCVGVMLPVMVLTVCYLIDTSRQTTDVIAFDGEQEGLVLVETIKSHDFSGKKETCYYVLADGQRIQAAAPFEGDAYTVYTMDTDNMGDVLPCMRRENGDEIEIPEAWMAVIDRLNETEHWKMFPQLMETQDGIFVYVELNVNWWTPCCLYYYNPEKETLTLLYKWNGEEVKAVKVLQPDKLRTL